METMPFNPASQLEFLKSKNLRILLADDNRVNQFLGKRILQNIGVSFVELASDGNEAYSKISAAHFDVLLTDVEMPGMNGYELARAVHQLDKSRQIPLIIALTANASEQDRELAKAAGIHDYLTKPYSPQDLMDVLYRYFCCEDVFVMEEISIQNSFQGAISLQRLVEVFHHNREDIRHFLMMLSQQLPQLISEIKRGIAGDDWDAAFQAAHKLKSPVSLLTDSSHRALLEKLTEDLRNRHELFNCPARFDELLPVFESILVLINTELEKPE